MSSFCGVIREIGGIAVDNFTGKNLNARAYFLSHCHTDHTQGLSSSSLETALRKNCAIYIYMTKITAQILMSKCANIKNRFKLVDCDESIDIKLPAHNGFDEEFITLTAVPAGHCPGSVMFIFRKVDGANVLYTGDFRIKATDISAFKQLHNPRGDPLKFECMYVDSTFLNWEFDNFPKRSECVQRLYEAVHVWLSRGKQYVVVLYTAAHYGYEYLFVSLARMLRMKVGVPEDLYKVYSLIPSMDGTVTKDIESTRIHVCQSQNKSTYLNFPDESVLKVSCTAYYWKGYELGDTPVIPVHERQLRICYPTHCSKSEVESFIAYFECDRIEHFATGHMSNEESHSVTDANYYNNTNAGMFDSINNENTLTTNVNVDNYTEEESDVRTSLSCDFSTNEKDRAGAKGLMLSGEEPESLKILQSLFSDI